MDEKVINTDRQDAGQSVQFGTAIPMWLVMREASRGNHKGIGRVLDAMVQAGYSWFRVGDHVADPGMSHHEGEDREQLIYGDPFATLAYLAPLNEKMQFLISVLIMPLRHPVLAANAVATVDRLTGGRLILGVGSGYAKADLQAVGVDMKERFARTEESLRALITLLEQPRASFEGQFVRFNDVSLTCRPLTKPRPTIWVGGVGEQTAARAARLADAWHPSISGYERAPGLTPRKLAEMVRVAEGVRKELGKPKLRVTGSTAIAMTFLTDPKPFKGAADARDRFVNGTGGPEELAELIDAYYEAGMTGFVMDAHAETTLDGCLRAIDTFATKVKPRLSCLKR